MYKALFLHIPRTAGTFLSNYFSAAGGFYIHGHKNLSEVNDLGDFFVFAFIRNPWDWYVSRYSFEKSFRALPPFKEYMKSINNYWLINVFNELCFKDNKYAVDYMGRFENIEKSIKDINTLSGITPKIAYETYCKADNKNRINASTHRPYIEYYDDESINIVMEKDKIIIDKFDYSFGK